MSSIVRISNLPSVVQTEIEEYLHSMGVRAIPVAISTRTEMIEISSGFGEHRETIPGVTYCEIVTVDRDRISVGVDQLNRWLAATEEEACMWCGRLFRNTDERDAHEETCV